MAPRLRRFALTMHVTSSVGWLGAVAGFLALALAGLTSQEAQMVRAAYLAMEVTAWYVIVPLALASLVTGLVSSLGTKWGLFRHYWVLAKFLLTVFATVVLLLKLEPISHLSGVAAASPLSASELRQARMSLVVHAGGGLLILLLNTVLGVYKPGGMTRYGRRTVSRPTSPRRQPIARTGEETPLAALSSHTESNDDADIDFGRGSTPRTPWRLYVWMAIIGLILMLIVLHLTGRVPAH